MNDSCLRAFHLTIHSTLEVSFTPTEIKAESLASEFAAACTGNRIRNLDDV